MWNDLLHWQMAIICIQYSQSNVHGSHLCIYNFMFSYTSLAQSTFYSPKHSSVWSNKTHTESKHFSHAKKIPIFEISLHLKCEPLCTYFTSGKVCFSNFFNQFTRNCVLAGWKKKRVLVLVSPEKVFWCESWRKICFWSGYAPCSLYMNNSLSAKCAVRN